MKAAPHAVNTENSKYDTQQAAKVIRTLCAYLTKTPFAFAAEGVFRIPGNSNAEHDIINAILEDRDFHQNTYRIHDYISAFKIVLVSAQLNTSDKALLRSLSKEILRSKPEIAANSLAIFINKLIKSGEVQDFYIAEIVYRYFYLAKHALMFENKNKMTADNLSRMLGPVLESIIQTDEPSNRIALTLKLNEVCRVLLLSDSFSTPFEKRYSSEINNVRKNTIQKLTAYRDQLLGFQSISIMKVSEYKDKLKALKIEKECNNISHKQKQTLEYTIEQYRQLITALKTTQRENIPKLKQIESEIEDLELKLVIDQKPCELDITDSDDGIDDLLADLENIKSGIYFSRPEERVLRRSQDIDITLELSNLCLENKLFKHPKMD